MRAGWPLCAETDKELKPIAIRAGDKKFVSDSEQVGVGDVVCRHQLFDSHSKLLRDREQGVPFLHSVGRLVKNTYIGGGPAGNDEHCTYLHNVGVGDRVAIERDQLCQRDSVLFRDLGKSLAGLHLVRARPARQAGINGPTAGARLLGGTRAGNQKDLPDPETVLVAEAVDADQLVQR